MDEYIPIHFGYDQEGPCIIIELSGNNKRLLKFPDKDSEFNKNYFRILDGLYTFLQNKIEYKGILREQYEIIIGEISGFLKQAYDGFKPVPEGFISWFLSNKMHYYLQIEVDIETKPIHINFTLNNGKLNDIQILDQHFHEYFEWRKEQFLSSSRPSDVLNLGQPDNIGRPIFIKEQRDVLMLYLSDYFQEEDKSLFKALLEEGKQPLKKLLFMGDAIKLLDTFRKLWEGKFIVGCTKVNLIDWILLNFQFVYRGKPKSFNKGTAEKAVSSNDYQCKKPVIKIEKGIIVKDQTATKKTRNR